MNNKKNLLAIVEKAMTDIPSDKKNYGLADIVEHNDVEKKVKHYSVRLFHRVA